VARRGCSTSTRGRGSTFVDFDGDAAKYRSATMATALTPTNTNKTLIPVRLIKFIPFI
jgi:hypothetical protein